MEELSEKIDRLLNSPDGMKRVEEMMTALGASSAPPEPDPPPLAGLPDLGKMMQLLPLLEKMQRPDDNAALLSALRPHLKADRQKRLDEAGQMLKIVRLLPLLQDMKEEGDRHE